MTSAIIVRTALSTEADPQRAIARAAEDIVAGMDGAGVDFAAVFLSPHHVEYAGPILKDLHARLRPGRVIGSTGAAVIGEGREIEDGPALAIWAGSLPDVRVDAFRLTVHDAGKRYAFRGFPEAIDDEAQRRGLVLLVDPFTTPTRDLIEQANRDYPGLPVIGGIASAGQRAGSNRLLLDDEVAHVGVTGVLFSGGVTVDMIVAQGCRPVGRTYLITEVENNVIHSLGRRPALERLNEVFHEVDKADRRLIRDVRSLHVGIAANEYQRTFRAGDFLVRRLVGIDAKKGSIALMGLPRAGQTMQFHLRDAVAARAGLQDALATAASGGRAAGAMLISCTGRGRRLFNEPDHDVRAVRKHFDNVPCAGLFAAGEIGPIQGRTFIHGYSLCLALFRAAGAGPARAADQRVDD